MRAKRIINLFLSIVMCASIFTSVGITAQAAIRTISFGETVSGECDYEEPDDYYEFKVPVSGTVTFDVTGTTYRVSKHDSIEILVYDSPYNMEDYSDDYEIFADYSEAFGYGIGKKSIDLRAGTYYIRTRPWCSSGNWYDYYDYSFILTYKPNILKPSAFKTSSRGTTSLKLSWRKISGADGYQLQRKSGSGSWKTIANTELSSYTAKGLKAGTTYSFRVRSYRTVEGKKYYSGWTTLKTSTAPSKLSISTLSTNSRHEITAKWKKVSACSGYQVQFSTSSNFKSPTVKNVSGNSKTSCTAKLKMGKKYYVRVRAYKVLSGKKYYGAWSSVKSIKCK